ncbi:(2Fe-2S)-binding protein [Streptomyces misionensis]|uniref:(2Fe-2S)-binding protein n=1 Tax=Streptomyces misionensis TaxID=67331 RepID=UPI00368ACA4B
MTDDQHGEGTPEGGGRWNPLPGDYDDGATAFVKLPEGGIDALLSGDSPLAAPGHGYVPPRIPQAPAEGAAGGWPAADGGGWPDPGTTHGGTDDRFTYDPAATQHWTFEEPAAPAAPGHDVTGQWSIPVAGGELPDESGEFTTSSLVEQWGGTPPATLPGGAPAPWATNAGQPWGQAAGAAAPVADGYATGEGYGTEAGHAPGETYGGASGETYGGPGGVPGEAYGAGAGEHPGDGDFGAGRAQGAYAGPVPGVDTHDGYGHVPGADQRVGHAQAEQTQTGHPQAGHPQAEQTHAGHPQAGHPQDLHAGAHDGGPQDGSAPGAYGQGAYEQPAPPDGAPAHDPHGQGAREHAGHGHDDRIEGPLGRAGQGQPGHAEAVHRHDAAHDPSAHGESPYATPDAYAQDGRAAEAHHTPPAGVPLEQTAHDPATAPERPVDGPADHTAPAEPGAAPEAVTEPGTAPAASDGAEGAADAAGREADAVPAAPVVPEQRTGAPAPTVPEQRSDTPAPPAGGPTVPAPARDGDTPVTASGTPEHAVQDAPEPADGARPEPDDRAERPEHPDRPEQTEPSEPFEGPEQPAESAASALGAPEAPGTPDASNAPDTADTADTPDVPEEAAPLPPHDDHPLASYVLRVNGSDRRVADAWIGESLLYVLRERLGLAGAKDGCSQGECGACNVQVDGRLVASCLVPAVTAAGTEVRTVEGLAKDGQPSDVQRALARCGAVQCGFCVPGMAMTVHDLLEGNPAPTELETRQALCGNLCRCSGYRGVVQAVQEVVAEREAAHAPEPEADTVGEARIPQQAAPGSGGVGPSAFEAPGAFDTPPPTPDGYGDVPDGYGDMPDGYGDMPGGYDAPDGYEAPDGYDAPDGYGDTPPYGTPGPHDQHYGQDGGQA